jgi:hypothetical protein
LKNLLFFVYKYKFGGMVGPWLRTNQFAVSLTPRRPVKR